MTSSGTDLYGISSGALRVAAMYRISGQDDDATFERMVLDGPGIAYIGPGNFYLPRTPSWGAARNVEVVVLPGVQIVGPGTWPLPSNGNWVHLETLGGGTVAFAVRATPPGSQLIPSSVYTALSFADPTVAPSCYDTAGYWNAAQPSRLVAPATGVYHFDAALGFAGSNQGTIREVDVRLNGSVVLARFASAPPATYPWYGNTSRDVELLAGDYLELLAFEDANLQTGTAHALDTAALNTQAMNSGVSTPTGLATLGGVDTPLLDVTYLGALP